VVTKRQLLTKTVSDSLKSREHVTTNERHAVRYQTGCGPQTKDSMNKLVVSARVCACARAYVRACACASVCVHVCVCECLLTIKHPSTVLTPTRDLAMIHRRSAPDLTAQSMTCVHVCVYVCVCVRVCMHVCVHVQ